MPLAGEQLRGPGRVVVGQGRRRGASVVEAFGIRAQVVRAVQDRLQIEDFVAVARLQRHADTRQAVADPKQIRQVLWNLIKNAIQAMPDGGAVEVLARWEGSDRARVVIEVVDEGLGIPEATRDRVYDPFFTTKSNGTGLGLAIVYQIIESHGGRVKFTTAEGRGTTFTLVLPARNSSSQTRLAG